MDKGLKSILKFGIFCIFLVFCILLIPNYCEHKVNAGTGIPVMTGIDADGPIQQTDGQYVKTDEVRARDSDGLAIYDDSGGGGLFIRDDQVCYMNIGHALQEDAELIWNGYVSGGGYKYIEDGYGIGFTLGGMGAGKFSIFVDPFGINSSGADATFTAGSALDIDLSTYIGAFTFGAGVNVEEFLTLPYGTTGPTSNEGRIQLDTDGDGSTVTQGVLKVYDGTQFMYYFGVDTYPGADNYIIKYDQASNKLAWEADATGGGGSAVILDLADDDSNESTDLQEIAITNDTNSIFTEPTADKLKIDVGQNWPTSDTANTGDSATSFFSSGTIEVAVGGTGASDAAGAKTNLGFMTDVVDDTTPQLGGDLDLNSHYVELDPTPDSDDTGSGAMATMIIDAGATVAVGDCLCTDTDGELIETDADAFATARCEYIALETGTGSKKVLVWGFIRNDGWNWTTVGGYVYVSATTGEITETVPSTTGQYVTVVGVVTHADRIRFIPSLVPVEVP